MAAVNLLGERSLAAMDKETSSMIWIGTSFWIITCLSLTKERLRGRMIAISTEVQIKTLYNIRFLFLRDERGRMNFGFQLKKKKTQHITSNAKLIRNQWSEIDISLW
ncbi:MAG: hypothetical protein WCJ45_08125 [bacterium]